MTDARAPALAVTTGPWPPDPGLPTLVFIHGSSGDAGMWSHQITGLAGVANTVAVDLPGHGRSAGPGCDTVAAYARSVADTIAALGLPDPVCCGLSLGGAIVQQLMLDFPSRLRAGVLMGTGARLRVLPDILKTIAADYPRYVMLLEQMAAAAETPRRQLHPVLEAARKCDPEVALGDFTACDRFDVTGRLGEIRTPVLVLCGTEDRLTPPKYARFLADRIPLARRVEIPGAGHLVPLEQPAAVNRALSGFLREHAGGVTD